MDSVFGLHHVAHAHNAEVGADSLGGHDARSMRDARRDAEKPGVTANQEAQQ
jgi:enoyl-CoA hydratase